ncbi:hypothetical protein RD792_009933 [Penstemon davidsonii]|uniref:Protein kinase domain-containing protein n=1 Tax=Penstemon davidsonii TaxID=160366 RepID=A0ABR0D0K9_9LAMI|nr:hypothetical protein RD792_009933 [Penstemon davidsonii]
MSDDMLLHFASNSSNQSDQSSKIAKLEARLVGKASSAAATQPQVQSQLNSWPAPDNLPDSLGDTDDSDDDNGREFLIIANTQKRRKVEEDSSSIVEDVEGSNTSGNVHQTEADARQKTADSSKAGADVNKKKQGRGRASSASGRGRGHRASDQPRNQIISPSNGQIENSHHKEELTSLRAKVATLEEELRKSREAVSDYQSQCERLEKELKNLKDSEQQLKPKRMKVISDLLISVSKAERQEARMKVRQDSLRLGNVGVIRAGTVISEAWEDGQSLKDLNVHLALGPDPVIGPPKPVLWPSMRFCLLICKLSDSSGWLPDIKTRIQHSCPMKSLLETKEAIERQRKSLKKRQSALVMDECICLNFSNRFSRRPDKVVLSSLTSELSFSMNYDMKWHYDFIADKGDVAETEGGIQEEDILIQDEIYKSRIASIKREEEAVLRERDRYELEKGRLIREMKRIREEDGSRFNNFQILNHCYVHLNFLGKGRFTEVYEAFDLVEHRYVACKLHGLNAQWSEDKKQNYVRHAIREYNIHKTLVHHHIVRLWDIFEIDHNTFCTVLEYCCGKDLDAVLKATPVLPEREARIIIIQIFRGLIYLNKRSQKIIHYDLKPGNVLFDEFGIAKVTDFGLSKIVEDDVGSQGMELTSQGAGTYWYLPPECFELSKTPLISSKVDVWSAGILLYQMLFGRRPFGHDQTQERILREDTIIRARKVEFPSRPSVSNEAKDFIRRCLTYNQGERPDVLAIAQDPYLNYTKK